MNMGNSAQVLDELEQAITAENIERPDPMPGDSWLLRSALQKAIRRGEAERAMQAAASLWRVDRKTFWRRLHTTALEDVSVNEAALVQTLTAVSATPWRKRVGDERVALYLSKALADAEKCRMGDQLFIQAERHSGYADFRERLAKADDKLLAHYAAHENSPLIERALSLWYLAGTRKFKTEAMPQRQGEPDKAVKVLRSLDAPAVLIESCIGVMGKTSWPLSIFAPLIWQEIRKQPRPLYVFYDSVPAMPDVEGLPVYAADMFTRTGQASIRQLQRAVPVFKQFSVRQIGLGLFYLEGCRLNKVLTCEFMEQFRQDAEIIDVESAGLDLPSYLGLRECLTQHIETLNGIRAEQLRKHLSGGEA
jgi:hypothetical protein